MQQRSVLIIEDEIIIADLVKLHLRDLGCQVKLAFDGLVGVTEAEAKRYDLIILDLMLPGIDGLEVCRRLRGKSNYTPILMLTAKSSDLDRVLGLEMGADDYLTKPFNIMELVARVKAIFRRVDALQADTPGGDGKVVSSRGITLDANKREAIMDGRSLDLTSKEFDLLFHLLQNRDRVYSRSQLLDHVWGYQHSGYEHTVNSFINRLRNKIEPDPAKPRYIVTMRGVGYKFSTTGHGGE
ncbi:MAG: response regulator transcription factor [Burkholderiales bacterium]|nr:response regulator transcription factor [Burkholderiales bacterium]MDQ3195824.1 response regulator transcription factor [Pseudomonadota bacterium]